MSAKVCLDPWWGRKKKGRGGKGFSNSLLSQPDNQPQSPMASDLGVTRSPPEKLMEDAEKMLKSWFNKKPQAIALFENAALEFKRSDQFGVRFHRDFRCRYGD